MSTDDTDAPDIRIDRVPNFCSLGPRPIVMDGFFRTMMRDHFSNPKSIEHRQFRERLWTAEECDRGLEIELSYVWRPTATNKRPTIAIRRNGWKAIKMGIANRTGTTPEGHEQFSKFMQGSHTLFCIAKEGPEANILAAETYRYLLHFGPVVRRYFDLHMFEFVELGELSELQEASERYAVPITVTYAWEEAWTLFHHQPWLKRIQLSALVPTV